jgi:ferritin
MISQKMQDAINAQINAELYSSYLYMSMAAYFETLNLSGMANWMTIQAQEEKFHADKFYHFLNERGGRVIFSAIDAPETEWDSPLAVFEATLAHEQKVTGLINDLMDLARSEKDHASEIFLQWYVSEQVEEESSADDIIAKMKLVKDHPQGLFMMDQQLSQRSFTPPAAEGE